MSTKRQFRRTLPALVILFFVTLAPSLVFAQDAAVSGGDIVRRKLLYRSTRFEVAPQIGFSVGDSYKRNMLAGASLAYHLTNEFGIGVSGGFGVLQLDTDLATNLNDTLEVSRPASLRDISYTYMQWQADLGISYVPIFGKFTVLKSATINYDFHASAGISIVNEKAEAAVDGGNIDQGIEGIKPGAMLQFGARLYLSDMLSLNFEMKNLLYSRAEISRGQADSEFRNRVVFFVGLGIFLPGEVKISR